MKKTSVITGLFLLFAIAIVSADDVLTVTSPSPWMTLRTDSLAVSIQADQSQIGDKPVALKVSRNVNGRASTLMSKSVKVEEGSADIFIGRVKDVPFGGKDYLSLEWSVPGTEFKGVIQPIGVVKLDDGKNVPALSAVKLKDGVSETQAADVLTGSPTFEAGGVKFAAGWNAEGFFILLKAAENVTEVQLAIDGKCGKSAFLSWADRFIIYSAEKDSVYGVHYKRSVDKNSVTYESMPWGDSRSLTLAEAEISRLIKIKWYDIGLQPFEERNMGFAAFVASKGRKVSLPAAARHEIPGTWGDIKLEK